MDKINNVRIVDCGETFFIHPCRMLYEQDGKEKTWELMLVHDSVAIVIYNISRHVLVFVKQFRPAVYFAGVAAEDKTGEIDIKKYPPSKGVTIELCAGIVDKNCDLPEIARQEVLEECGYDVPLSSFEKISSYRLDVGVAGTTQTTFYVEVTDAMKVSEGGGNISEGEYIEVVELDFMKAYSLIDDEEIPRPVSLVAALMWFFYQKKPLKIDQILRT